MSRPQGQHPPVIPGVGLSNGPSVWLPPCPAGPHTWRDQIKRVRISLETPQCRARLVQKDSESLSPSLGMYGSRSEHPGRGKGWREERGESICSRAGQDPVSYLQCSQLCSLPALWPLPFPQLQFNHLLPPESLLPETRLYLVPTFLLISGEAHGCRST